jgi:hypothetical protein
MKVFLLDLWLDLREKRLAPVALLLLAGVIAVPIVLAKKAEPPPAAPTATTAAAAPSAPVVAGQASAGTTNSKLQTFSARDPFEPTAVPAAAGGTTTGTTTTPATTTPTTTPGTGTTGSGTTTPGGGTNGTGPTPGTGTTTPETKTTLFTYTADLKFGAGGDQATFKDVKRLQLIPDEKTPKIVFLGVTTTGKTAVFLIDSNIGVDTGEGKCRPSPDNCTFLYLRPDKDHDQATLTDSDGTVFHLRLIDINRVTVSSANGTTGTGNSNSNSNSNGNSGRSPAFTGSAKPKSNSATVPGETPPGEPTQPSSFQQLFADGTQ